MCSTWRLGLGVMVLWPLVQAGVSAGAQEVPVQSMAHEPPTDVIAAWTKAGAVYGGPRVTGVDWTFTASAPLAPGEIPTFRFAQTLAQRLANLPAIHVKDLAVLKQLESLSLERTRVTEAGLMDLREVASHLKISG